MGLAQLTGLDSKELGLESKSSDFQGCFHSFQELSLLIY